MGDSSGGFLYVSRRTGIRGHPVSRGQNIASVTALDSTIAGAACPRLGRGHGQDCGERDNGKKLLGEEHIWRRVVMLVTGDLESTIMMLEGKENACFYSSGPPDERPKAIDIIRGTAQ